MTRFYSVRSDFDARSIVSSRLCILNAEGWILFSDYRLLVQQRWPSGVDSRAKRSSHSRFCASERVKEVAWSLVTHIHLGRHLCFSFTRPRSLTPSAARIFFLFLCIDHVLRRPVKALNKLVDNLLLRYSRLQPISQPQPVTLQIVLPWSM